MDSPRLNMIFAILILFLIRTGIKVCSQFLCIIYKVSRVKKPLAKPSKGDIGKGMEMIENDERLNNHEPFFKVI